MKIDLGCGPNKKEGFLGVDQYPMEGVDIVMNLLDAWPWEDGSVDEIHCSHVFEHFDARGRCHIANEAYRVLRKPDPKADDNRLRLGGTMTIITPHWRSARAYGDPTHMGNPVCEWTYLYMNRSWRDQNAPHSDGKWNGWGYVCDFDWTQAMALTPEVSARNEDYRTYAITHLCEAVTDLIVTLTRRE